VSKNKAANRPAKELVNKLAREQVSNPARGPAREAALVPVLELPGRKEKI
jgi:hypothetical protein